MGKNITTETLTRSTAQRGSADSRCCLYLIPPLLRRPCKGKLACCSHSKQKVPQNQSTCHVLSSLSQDHRLTLFHLVALAPPKNCSSFPQWSRINKLSTPVYEAGLARRCSALPSASIDRCEAEALALCCCRLETITHHRHRFT